MLVLDGNMKNRRDVCMARDAGYTEYEGIPGSIKTGCMNSPEQTSRFCKIHQIRMCNPCPVVDADEAAPSVSQSKDGIVESIIDNSGVSRNLSRGVLKSSDSAKNFDVRPRTGSHAYTFVAAKIHNRTKTISTR